MGSRYKTVGNTVVSETNFKLYVLTKRKSYGLCDSTSNVFERPV